MEMMERDLDTVVINPQVAKRDVDTVVVKPQVTEGDVNVEIACSRNIFLPPGANLILDSKGSTIITAQPGTADSENSNGSLLEVNSNETMTAIDIGDKLRKYYRKLELPVVSWMKGGDLPLENYFVPLQLTSSRWSRGRTDENYNLENIFDCDDNDHQSRILIESQAGYGKTTLVHKIMHDWVNQKEYVRPFEYTVMIILKHLKGRTLKQAVLDEINLLKISNEQVWRVINNDKTLLLLDGLDEVSENDRQSVLDTLYDNVGYKMTIIVTCRVGMFKLEDEERRCLFRGAAMSEIFWDKTIAILGCIGDNRDTFLEKFVEEENRGEILKKIKDFITQAEELFESPLMLILLIFITRENPKYEIKTKTDLFKNLIDCIIKRSVCDKDVGKLEKNFTLFDRKTRDGYQDLLCKFGEVSMHHILNGDLQFECDEFTDLIYCMGLLTKHEKKCKLETLTHYECFHLTILEFAAAFALWDQFKNNGNEFPVESINKLNKLHLKKAETSMVIPFLCGLMERDVVKFFTQFADYCAMYSAEQGVMELILNECMMTEDLYGAVSKFIPPLYFCDNLQTLLLTNFNLYQNIVSLVVSTRQLWVLARERNIHVKSIMVFFTEDSRFEDTDHYLRNDVICDNLFVDTIGKVESYENFATQFKLVLCCVCAKYKYISIGSTIRVDFLSKCVDNGIFNNQTINYLSYELPINFDTNATESEIVRNFFGNVTVKQLAMRFHSAFNWDFLLSVIPTIADSPSIASLCILNCSLRTLKLDLNKIVKKEEKCWDFLGLSNFEVVCTIPTKKDNCIKSLNIYENISGSCVDVLYSLQLTELMCDFGSFQSILSKPNFSSWIGYESIVNLTLILDGQTAPTHVIPYWEKFRNLEFVTLYVLNNVNQKLQSKILNDLDLQTQILKHLDLQSEIIKYLNLLKTTRLLLHWKYSSDYSRVFCNYVSGIQNLVQENKLQLVKTIDFEIVYYGEFGLVSKFDTVIESIIAVVECDSKITATFIFSHSNESLSVSRQLLNSVDFSNLNVQQIMKETSTPYLEHNFQLGFYFPYLRVFKLQRQRDA